MVKKIVPLIFYEKQKLGILPPNNPVRNDHMFQNNHHKFKFPKKNMPWFTPLA